MSAGMQLRLGWAILAAICGGLWLWCSGRIVRPTEASAVSSPRLLRGLRVGVHALAVFWSVTWLILAIRRFPYPFELEWVGGAMRDHCFRLLTGLPLYAPPGPDWIPYEYPPLYMWIAAQISR